MKARIAFLTAALIALLAAAGLRLGASEGAVQWEALPKPGMVELFYDEGVDPETRLFFQQLNVEVREAPPHTSFDVFVKGKHLGQLVTDAFGVAQLEIEREDVIAGSDGRPRRRIDTGDVCEVVSDGRVIADTFEIAPPPADD